MKIVAICGQKQTGKDLASSIIFNTLNEQGYLVRKFKFSAFVKNCVCSIFGLKPDIYESFLHKSFDIMGKTFKGKDLERAIENNLRLFNNSMAINSVENEIYSFKGFHRDELDKSVILITDLRFKDEVKWARANSVIILKIKRDLGVVDTSIKQRDIDDYFADIIVDNNSDETELEAKIKTSIIPQILKGKDTTL